MASFHRNARAVIFLLLCLQGLGLGFSATIKVETPLDLADSKLSLSSAEGEPDISSPIPVRYQRKAHPNSQLLNFVLQRFQGVLNKIEVFRNTLNLNNSQNTAQGLQNRVGDTVSSNTNSVNSRPVQRLVTPNVPKRPTSTSLPRRLIEPVLIGGISTPASVASFPTSESSPLGIPDFDDTEELPNQVQNAGDKRRFQRQNVLNSDDSDLAPTFGDDDDDQESLPAPTAATTTTTNRPPTPTTTTSVPSTTSTTAKPLLTISAQDALQIQTQKEVQKIQNAVKEPEGNVLVQDFDSDLDDTRDFAPFPSFDDEEDQGNGGGFDFNPEVEIPALKLTKSSASPPPTTSTPRTTTTTSLLRTSSVKSPVVEQGQNVDDEDLPPSFGDGYDDGPGDFESVSSSSTTKKNIISTTSMRTTTSTSTSTSTTARPTTTSARSTTSVKPTPTESNLPPSLSFGDEIEQLIDYDSDPNPKSGNQPAQGGVGSGAMRDDTENILATLLKSISSTTAVPRTTSDVKPLLRSATTRKPAVAAAPATPQSFPAAQRPSNPAQQDFRSPIVDLNEAGAPVNLDNLSNLIRDHVLQSIYSAIRTTTGNLFSNTGNVPAHIIHIGPININTGSNGQVSYGTLEGRDSKRNLRPFSTTSEENIDPTSSVAASILGQQLKNQRLGIRAMGVQQENSNANFPERNFSPGSAQPQTALFQEPGLTSSTSFSPNNEGPPLPILLDPELQDFPPSPVLTASRGFRASEEAQAPASTKPVAEPSTSSNQDGGPPVPVSLDYDDADLFDTRLLRPSKGRAQNG